MTPLMVDTEVKVEVFINLKNIYQIMNSYGSETERRYFFKGKLIYI